jgi:hypothetical protein
MRTLGTIAACASLLGGCAQVVQGENSFRSPLVVGYSDGSAATRANALAQVYDLPGPGADGAVIKPGECIAILVHDGRVNSASENKADQLVSRVTRRGLVAEWQITTTVTERRDPAGESTTETTIMPSTVVVQRLSDGSPRPERIPYRNAPIYGPRVYHGGPISLKIALSELDEKEAEFNKKLVDSAYDKSKDVLPKINMADVAKNMLATGFSVVTKLGTGEIVALGVEAAKLAWNIYNSVHKADDVWLDESEGWLPANYLSADQAKATRMAQATGARVLKTGVWTLARVSQRTSDHSVTGMQYDLRSPSQLLMTDRGDGPGEFNTPTFIALRFVAYAPAAGGKCTP